MKKLFLYGLPAILILALILSGCGGGGGTPSNPTNPTPTPTSSPVSEDSLKGTWMWSRGNNSVTLQIGDRGTAAQDTITGAYSYMGEFVCSVLDGGKITITGDTTSANSENFIVIWKPQTSWYIWAQADDNNGNTIQSGLTLKNGQLVGWVMIEQNGSLIYETDEASGDIFTKQ